MKEPVWFHPLSQEMIFFQAAQSNNCQGMLLGPAGIVPIFLLVKTFKSASWSKIRRMRRSYEILFHKPFPLTTNQLRLFFLELWLVTISLKAERARLILPVKTFKVEHGDGGG